MKKLLIGIFTFLIGFISFSSAEIIHFVCSGGSCSPSSYSFSEGSVIDSYSDSTADSCVLFFEGSFNISSIDGDYSCSSVAFNGSWTECNGSDYPTFPYTITSDSLISLVSVSCNHSYDFTGFFSVSSPSVPEIIVYYNDGSSTSIACDGENSIAINGLSTLYGDSTFVPFFNISYVDENNQKLIESYDKEILYLSGGLYHKTYTGNNDRILSVVNNSESSFTGYLPTFDVTGNITELDTGNVFNNFAENSLSVLLSNIPNYIQYVIMFLLLLFILSIFRKLR